ARPGRHHRWAGLRSFRNPAYGIPGYGVRAGEEDPARKTRRGAPGEQDLASGTSELRRSSNPPLRLLPLVLDEFDLMPAVEPTDDEPDLRRVPAERRPGGEAARPRRRRSPAYAQGLKAPRWQLDPIEVLDEELHPHRHRI